MSEPSREVVILTERKIHIHPYPPPIITLAPFAGGIRFGGGERRSGYV